MIKGRKFRSAISESRISNPKNGKKMTKTPGKTAKTPKFGYKGKAYIYIRLLYPGFWGLFHHFWPKNGRSFLARGPRPRSVLGKE